MVDTIKNHGDDVVSMVNGVPQTFKQLLAKHGIDDPDSLTVEGLGLQPGYVDP